MLVGLFLLMLGCSGHLSDKEAVKASVFSNFSKPSNPLIGSWKMISYKYGNENTFKDMDDKVMKEIKLITETHFTWASFDEQEMIGAGGGSYSYEDGKYIEHIEYFHPIGSNMIGSSQVFECKLEDGKWYHSGYIKKYEIDPETLDFVAVDSSKIEEVWVRMEKGDL